MSSYEKLITKELSCHQDVRPSYLNKAEFAQWSYSDWALKELLGIVKEASTCPILIRIGEFINQMNEYQCINSIFSPAYDMAQYILDLCIAESERSNQK